MLKVARKLKTNANRAVQAHVDYFDRNSYDSLIWCREAGNFEIQYFMKNSLVGELILTDVISAPQHPNFKKFSVLQQIGRNRKVETIRSAEGTCYLTSNVTAQQRRSDSKRLCFNNFSTPRVATIGSNIAFCFRCDEQNEHRSIKLHYTFCLAHTASSIRFTFLLEVFLLLPVHGLIVYFPDTLARSLCTRSKLLRFSLLPSSCSFDGPIFVAHEIAFFLYLIYSQPYLELTSNVMRNKES